MEKRPEVESMEVKKPKSKQRVLVTGDRGYIGCVVVKKLLEAGYDVTGLDSGFFDKSALQDQEIEYKKITKDIRDVVASDIEGVNSIIHLAALSNDPIGAINPDLTNEINHKSSVKLAKLAKKKGIAKFIFSSSCSVYGIAENGIVDENSMEKPLTAYAKSKIATEKELSKLADDSFFVGLLRNSTVYGFSPRFRNDLVVNNLVTTALAFGEIRIMSDGTPWRPLIDVRDLSDIFIAFLINNDKSISGKIINIGFDENNTQVKDITSLIEKFVPNCKIAYTGEHGKDSRSYKVNFSKFKSKFPFIKQKWSIDRSIKDLVDRLKTAKFAREDFDSEIYTRLAVLKKLLSSGQINKDLHWIKNEV
jgi:nucleoside-diphosphate-sugar epimerase